MKRKKKKPVAWAGDAPGGNYTAKVLELSRQLGVGLNAIEVVHDDSCALLKSGLACNCDPEVRVRQPPATTGPGLSVMQGLAVRLAAQLNATPAADPPPRALFADGVIRFGETEIGIEITDVGHLFVRNVDGQLVVEGVVIKELDATVKQRRHRELKKWSEKIFGELDLHDPMGHLGPKTPSA